MDPKEFVPINGMSVVTFDLERYRLDIEAEA